MHGLLPDTINCGLRMRRDYRERFSHHRGLSDPDMHHSTCVRHAPWCMSGSLTSGFLWRRWRGNRSRYSRCMRNRQFYVSGRKAMMVECQNHTQTKHNNTYEYFCGIYCIKSVPVSVSYRAPYCHGPFCFCRWEYSLILQCLAWLNPRVKRLRWTDNFPPWLF